MGYSIKRVAVIGSGTMGGGIAAHVANAGIPVYLLDISQPVVSASLDRLKKSKPPAFFTPQTADLITIGNLSDNFDWIGKADWIVEAIVENLETKRELVARIEKVRKPNSIVSSNTSGIPISAIGADASEEFKTHFLGTHFFNPPRYMKLLEVIPTSETAPEVTEFMKTFCEARLGKGVVLCKDTPNFIGNRFGSISGAVTLNYILENNYTIEEADAVLGPLIGRPKTGMFRLQDLVGLDVSSSVGENLYGLIEHDESREVLRNPKLRHVRLTQIERGRLGDKTGQGFYKKPPKGTKGNIQSLDLQTLEYRDRIEPGIPSIEAAMKIKSLPKRLEFVLAQDDKAGALARHVIYNSLAYAARRIPEITDKLVNVDRAVRWGFSHELGPFEIWDALGVREVVTAMETNNIAIAPWVQEMLAAGHESFYVSANGRLSYYDPASKSYLVEPLDNRKIDLAALKATERGQAGTPALPGPASVFRITGGVVLENKSASLIDLGDGVLCLEFHSKMNTLDADIRDLINESVNEVEKNDWLGLIIGNQATDFCIGANLKRGIAEADPNSIDQSVRGMQDAFMRVRFCSKPVVTAPTGRTLGGGVEIAMAGSAIVASAETYMGLVEVSVGIVPGAGGCKELVRRIVSPAMRGPNNDPVPFLQQVLQTIAMAKVSTSGEEARSFGFLNSNDHIVMNREHQLAEAKKLALELAVEGYSAPQRTKSCYAAGRDALAALRAGLFVMQQGEFMSEYDLKVTNKVAYILCGGDLSSPQWVDEQHFLDLEREAFVELCGEAKTQERISYMLETGKPLRN